MVPLSHFFYPLLPSFLMPADPHAFIHDDLSIIDGASTYLAAYSLDFSYLGVYLANLALGLGCGWLMERALPKQILVSGIFLTCLSFIFFSDMFTPLSTIIQVAVQVAVQKRCFRWGTCRHGRGVGMSAVASFAVENRRAFRATVVIVLYRMEPAESPAFQSALQARAGLSEGDAVQILLWDNSPEHAPGTHLPADVRYVHDPRNLGLACAYNRGLELAIDVKSDWLITLDQDTSVPADYFLKMSLSATASRAIAGVGAVVPQIYSSGRIVSPNHFALGAIPRWFRRGYCGVPDEAVYAFNSGSMLSVAALQQIGGYDPWFWLDNSDAQIFSRLHQHGKRVYIAGDVAVQHDFSMKNMSERMSADRYRNADSGRDSLLGSEDESLGRVGEST